MPLCPKTQRHDYLAWVCLDLVEYNSTAFTLVLEDSSHPAQMELTLILICECDALDQIAALVILNVYYRMPPKDVMDCWS